MSIWEFKNSIKIEIKQQMQKKILVKLILFFITCADSKSAGLYGRADTISEKHFFAKPLKQSL